MDLTPKQLSEIVTFTRTGTATRVSSFGVVAAVAADTPRFDYDPITGALLGLLVEDARTNLALQSEAFENASWQKASCTISANATEAPDGNVAADKLIANNTITLTSAPILQTFTKAATATAYTWSIFAKAGEFNRAWLLLNDAATTANQASVTVSLIDGSFVFAASAAGTFTAASAVVRPFINGWYRISLTCTTSTETSIAARVYSRDSVATVGDGASGIFIWGAQLEAGAVPTSYIPTTTAAVGRGADIPIINAANFAQVYNQDEGTFFISVRPQVNHPSTSPRLFELNDGTAANRILVYGQPNRSINGRIDTATTMRSILIAANKLNAGLRVKMAYSFKLSDIAMSVDGGILIDTANTFIPSALSEISLGISRISGGALNGWIEQFRYFPNRLPNATLQALTA